MPPPAVLATVVDPQGRQVVLTRERWDHILDGHGELARHRDDVLRALISPTHRYTDLEEGEEWFFLEGSGPSRYLKVVVVYPQQGSGFIVTAWPCRRLP